VVVIPPRTALDRFAPPQGDEWDRPVALCGRVPEADDWLDEVTLT
jgi:hypothetical protein